MSLRDYWFWFALPLSAGGVACDCNPRTAEERPAEPAPPYDLDRPVGALAAPRSRDEGFHRGVSLGLFVSSAEDEVRRPIYEKFLDEIVDVGATHLELVVEWSQPDVSAIEITPHPTKPTDDELLTWVMDEAKERGLRVFLMPILDIEERAMGRWRGTLEPNDWDRWWWSYERFILHYARIAEQHHAALFAVGSELLSTERDQEHWRALIAKVRKRYKGELTYSANWDHFEPVSFWDALDVVGISGYHEITQKPDPSDDDLRHGLRKFAHRLRSWAQVEGHRYLFTEIGYPAQRHAPQRPWDYRESSPIDLAMQLRCYRALYEVFHGDPALDGLYFWNWFGEGGVSDGSYTPRGKPSAKVIEHWYRTSRAAIPASAGP